MPVIPRGSEARGGWAAHRARMVVPALALLVGAGAVAASGFSLGSLRSRPSSWTPRAWPPATVSSRRGPCDKIVAPDGSDRNRGTRRAPYRTAQALARALVA